jgi:3-deoxy-D-arabino-heptulosonate 7-phosphate (DAHP) synthase
MDEKQMPMSDIKREPLIETARRVIAEHRETLEALHKGETSSMPGWLLSIAVRAGCSAEEFEQLREYAKRAAELEREACAQICLDMMSPPRHGPNKLAEANAYHDATDDCAAAIRRRGTK